MNESIACASMPDVLRNKADVYVQLGLHTTAQFFADKAVSLSSSAADDTLRLARVYVASSQHRRALHLLNESGLTGNSTAAKLLASQCLFAVGEYDECLSLLDVDEEPSICDSQGFDKDKLRRKGRLFSAAAGNDNVKCSPRSGRGISAPHGKESPGFRNITMDTTEISPELQAALCVMRAKTYEELENTDSAAWWYKKALKHDIYCYEAFARLAETALEPVDVVAKFASDLYFEGSGNDDAENLSTDANPHMVFDRKHNDSASTMDADSAGEVKGNSASQTSKFGRNSSHGNKAKTARVWLKAFYQMRLDQSGQLPPLPSSVDAAKGYAVSTRNISENTQTLITASEIVMCENGMRDNIDVLKIRAIRLFDSLDFEGSTSLTRQILSRDPFAESYIVLLQLASLVELDERQALFVMAHSLVDTSPRDAVSWTAVGYYYFACKKYELARRYLQKSTSLNPRLVPAWLAIGHAYAAQDESDQAMAAYRTAARLYPGAQGPQLFMGMEYARQSSLSHASNYFESARVACPSDPAPCHELGVICYRMGDLENAIAHFRAALAQWDAIDLGKNVSFARGRRMEAEESSLFNLGHCYRRLRQLQNAKDCYERALALRPFSCSTCCALGMTLHGMGNASAAIAMYHRALRYHPEDTISAVMLDRALQDSCDLAT